MLTLAEMGGPMDVLNLIAGILHENRITFNDGAAELLFLTQTLGVAQKDNVCPLLLSPC